MKVLVTDIDSCKKKIVVEVPPDTVTLEREKVYAQFGKNVRLKGFRKGKVPRTIIEKYYKDEIESEIIRNIIPDTYAKVIKEYNIKTVGSPLVADLKTSDNTLSFSATVDVLPEIDEIKCDNIEIPIRIRRANDKDVDAELERIREFNAEYIPTEEVLEAGDCAVIDFEGFRVNKEPITELTTQNATIFIERSGAYPKEFHEHLLGKKKGEMVEFTLRFPENYFKKDIAGKEIVFNLKINETKKKVLPPLDNNFANNIKNAKDIDELRLKIKAEIEQLNKTHAENRAKDELLKRLIECNSFNIPASMVEAQAKLMSLDTIHALGKQGDKEEDIEKRLLELKEQYMPKAAEIVKGQLLLDKLATDNHVNVTEDEIDKELNSYAVKNNIALNRLKAKMIENGAIDRIRNQIRRQKALDVIFAKIRLKEELVLD